MIARLLNGYRPFSHETKHVDHLFDGGVNGDPKYARTANSDDILVDLFLDGIAPVLKKSPIQEPFTVITPVEIIDPNSTTSVIIDRIDPIQEIIQAATRVTKRTNIRVIRRRKMNIHKYKKRRRRLRKSTRHHMSKRRRKRPSVKKELEEIEEIKEFFRQAAKQEK